MPGHPPRRLYRGLKEVLRRKREERLLMFSFKIDGFCLSCAHRGKVGKAGICAAFRVIYLLFVVIGAIL
jgi:hypothetical protein